MVGKFVARDIEKQAYELKELERQLHRAWRTAQWDVPHGNPIEDVRR